ncbi:unnamed protein product [Adineta ricciae]|uniref:Phosphatidic acid phosphatase type 2/haloperoxidase domain-containing protein n=1 Tax=Adineta ricciae TaxID=249248 RepID=A0A814A988_ADIRI|nr:unnamed protein product [Adineta ricciae]CAF0971762.1 unnamed protein product [Adineta ricciae]
MLASGLAVRRSPPVTTDQFHHRESIWRIIVDIICLLILIAAAAVSNAIAKPFTRGFFCSDTSIRYPQRTNTIPTYAAIILSIGLPLLVMWFTEIFKRFYFSYYPKQPFLTRLEYCGTLFTYVSPFLRNLYVLTVIFAYGYVATWLLTEIAKNFVGELRPHFLAVCQPSYNCSAVTSLYQYDAYLQEGVDYTCQNTDAAAVREARRSFFSGHASSIFYGFAWLIMYLHVAWSWRHLGLLGHLLQVGLAVLAFYIGYTRISDFQHHWHDVLTGAIVGSLIAFFTFKFILDWHQYSPRFLPYTAGTQSQIPPPYQPRFGNLRPRLPFSSMRVRNYP